MSFDDNILRYIYIYIYMNLDDNTCYKLRDKFYFQKGKMRVRMSDLKINKNNL